MPGNRVILQLYFLMPVLTYVDSFREGLSREYFSLRLKKPIVLV